MHYFLILHLWHADHFQQSATGGPSLAIAPMPSLAVCEQVGAAAKKFADEERNEQRGDSFWIETVGPHANASLPAAFRCIAVK